ncbi:MAG: nucleotide exchange factor GrpE [Desulfobulbaceae bacterium]|nr:nucleotide exchange factor GrpE [Desulfobulbaceae bacterium]
MSEETKHDTKHQEHHSGDSSKHHHKHKPHHETHHEHKHEKDVEAKTGSQEPKETTTEAPKTAPTPEEKIALLEQEVGGYKDQLRRKAAEFENFRKQKEKEVITIRKFADEPLIKELLPVLDDIDRVLHNSAKFLESTPEAKTYIDGVKLVQQNLLKVFEARGLKRIDSVGKKFDVEYHEALTQMDQEGVESETVIQEYAPGYTLHDKVIRHAKVVVSR